MDSIAEQYALGTYGYVPSLAPNVVALVFFILLLIAQLSLDYKYKVVPNIVGWSGGIALEMMGYIGRVINHHNPENLDAYKLQLITLIMGPPFLMATIYLLLGRLVVVYGRQYSILSPRQYVVIFVISDIVARVLQIAGSSIAASATASNPSLRNTGHDITLAGVVFQVFSILVFFCLAASFITRALRDSPANHNPEYIHIRENPLFKYLIPAVAASTLLIFVRFVFRIAELAGGIDSSIARSERDFMVCDTLMVFLACLIMVVFHPSMCLGSDLIPLKTKKGDTESADENDTTVEKEERFGAREALKWVWDHRPSKMLMKLFK